MATVFQSGIVLFTQPSEAAKSAGAQLPAGNEPAIACRSSAPASACRNICGSSPRNIRHLPVEMEFAQDDVAEGHAQGGIGALLGVQPDVTKLGGFGIVRGR
jgi:hypothetical protein